MGRVIRTGDVVRDVNPDRTGADSFGRGIVVLVDIEDESTGIPTYLVIWGGARYPERHGPMDIALD